jgi:hypothetical protein
LAMHYIKGKEIFLANALFQWPLANAISMAWNTIIKDIKK